MEKANASGDGTKLIDTAGAMLEGCTLPVTATFHLDSSIVGNSRFCLALLGDAWNRGAEASPSVPFRRTPKQLATAFGLSGGKESTLGLTCRSRRSPTPCGAMLCHQDEGHQTRNPERIRQSDIDGDDTTAHL